MNRWIAATVAFALSTLATPLVAMVLVSSESYGEFSALYVLYSLATMLVTIAVCEPWSRSVAGVTELDSDATDPGYYDTAAAISFAGSIVVMFAGLQIVEEPHIVILAAAASAAGCLRLAGRYRAVGIGRLNNVLPADIFSTIMQAVVLTVGVYCSRPIEAVYASWLAGSVVGAIGLLPRVALTKSGRNIGAWFATHRRSMLGYLGDSGTASLKDVTLMTILLPTIGASGYGLYRAVGNATSPVRTIVLAIRPRLIIIGPQRTASGRAVLLIVSLSVSAGLLTVAVADLLSDSLAELGTLGSLLKFPVACGLAVSGSLMSQYFAGLCRGFVRLRIVVLIRLMVSIAIVAVIVVLALTFGFVGALYGFSVTLCIEGIVWAVVLRLHAASGRK